MLECLNKSPLHHGKLWMLHELRTAKIMSLTIFNLEVLVPPGSATAPCNSLTDDIDLIGSTLCPVI